MMTQRRRTFGVVLLAVMCCMATSGRGGSAGDQARAKAARKSQPRYMKDGALERPEDFRKWVFVGSSLGLSYAKHPKYEKDQLFHNVYIIPTAYEHYARTGKFPEKTMLAMAVYRQVKKTEAPIDLQGSFAGDLVALELAVKDSSQFEQPWAYFDFSPKPKEDSLRASAKPFPAAKCYDCHATHAADDNVFVQFYPVLRRLNDQAQLK
jgi:hypothetical protein